MADEYPPTVDHLEAPPVAPPRSLADFCTWHPQPGQEIGKTCPVCGHSDLVHIGTDHCPVCELVYQATPQWHRQQERIHGVPPFGHRRF